ENTGTPRASHPGNAGTVGAASQKREEGRSALYRVEGALIHNCWLLDRAGGEKLRCVCGPFPLPLALYFGFFRRIPPDLAGPHPPHPLSQTWKRGLFSPRRRTLPFRTVF